MSRVAEAIRGLHDVPFDAIVGRPPVVMMQAQKAVHPDDIVSARALLLSIAIRLQSNEERDSGIAGVCQAARILQ